VPATVPMLHVLNETGELPAVNGTAFALTPALRESYATGSAEELEYVAMLDAARASLRLIAADQEAAPRRVVISADLDDVTFRPDLDNSVVRVAAPIPMKVVASVHMDAPEAEPAVRAAVAVVDAADLGDSDAEFTLGDAEDHELAWYAPQELPFLLELM
jgi:tellurite resistance protein